MESGTDKHVIVYQDERYTLGQQDKAPYFTADGKTYQLFCHPLSHVRISKTETSLSW